MIKEYRTVAGIEDGSFKLREQRRCLFGCVIMRDFRIAEVKLSWISVDGNDVTEKLLNMLASSRGVEVLFSGGITFAGFNILDAKRIFEEAGVPVIIVSKRRPDNEAVLRALKKHFEDWEQRWSTIKRVGEVMEVVNIKAERLYVEVVGMDIEEAIEVINKWTLWGKRPEPLRVVNLIVKGLSRILEVEDGYTKLRIVA